MFDFFIKIIFIWAYVLALRLRVLDFRLRLRSSCIGIDVVSNYMPVSRFSKKRKKKYINQVVNLGGRRYILI